MVAKPLYLSVTSSPSISCDSILYAYWPFGRVTASSSTTFSAVDANAVLNCGSCSMFAMLNAGDASNSALTSIVETTAAAIVVLCLIISYHTLLRTGPAQARERYLLHFP